MLDAWIIQNAEDLQVGLFFTLFGVLTVVELVAPRRTGDRQRRSRWVANLSLTAVNIAVLSLLPVSFFAAAVWASDRAIGLLNLAALPLAVAVVGTLLGRAFLSFFTHYLMHEMPLLWRIHRVHHLDTEMDVSTTVRFHPIEFAVNLVVGVPVIAVLGLTPWVLLVYELLDVGVTLFSHANISLPARIERVVRYLIVTPDLHRVHHSSLQPETDSNFGAVFPIWDLLLGTFRTTTQSPQAVMELGLEEVRDHRTHNLLWLLASPVRKGLDPDDRPPPSALSDERGVITMSKTRRFSPPHLLLLTLVTLPIAHFAMPWVPLVPFPWNLAGLALVAAGIALNVVADALFKGYGSVRACRGPDVLVTGGPYGLSRNPMYLGFALILVGIALLLGTFTPLIFAVGFVPLAERLFIRNEEAVLAERHGGEWIAYAANVRRWL